MAPADGRQDREVVPFAVGDVVTLRKPHPCGGKTWQVRRVGADLGMECQTCGRRIMINRFEVQRRLASRIPAGSSQEIQRESSES